jgi:predicted DNA binding CopG/RHH family protein
MAKARKKIPAFRSENQERGFWASADSADYIDWSRAPRVSFPKLKPSTRTISLRLPASLLESLKVLANMKDVPYQSLLKIYLADRVREEFEPEK